MNQKFKEFEKLSHIKLYTYKGTMIEPDMPYEKKTINRIKKDLHDLSNVIVHPDLAFRIHAIYPQCYIIVWSNIDSLPKDTLLISEVIYTVENNTILPVICCQKCNRVVDTSFFKLADHEYLHVAGQHLVHFLSYCSKEISYHYTKRLIQYESSCTSVCKTVLNEIDMEYSSQDMHGYIICLAKAIILSDSNKMHNCYHRLFEFVRGTGPLEDQPRKILFLAPYIMTSLIYELQTLLPASSEMLQHILQVFLSELMQMNFFHDQIVFIQEFPYSLSRLVYPNLNSSFSPITQQTLQIIHSEYASKLKLQDIANRLNTQESYLSRLFKKDTKLSFTDYLMQYRLKRALILMDETSYSITDIALMVGFDSSTYFSTCYRKTYQLSPSAYRKSHSL